MDIYIYREREICIYIYIYTHNHVHKHIAGPRSAACGTRWSTFPRPRAGD